MHFAKREKKERVSLRGEIVVLFSAVFVAADRGNEPAPILFLVSLGAPQQRGLFARAGDDPGAHEHHAAAGAPSRPVVAFSLFFFLLPLLVSGGQLQRGEDRRAAQEVTRQYPPGRSVKGRGREGGQRSSCLIDAAARRGRVAAAGGEPGLFVWCCFGGGKK